MLAECRDCGAKVSTTATKCPRCGATGDFRYGDGVGSGKVDFSGLLQVGVIIVLWMTSLACLLIGAGGILISCVILRVVPGWSFVIFVAGIALLTIAHQMGKKVGYPVP